MNGPQPAAGPSPQPLLPIQPAGAPPEAPPLRVLSQDAYRHEAPQRLKEKTGEVVNSTPFTVFDKGTEARDAAEFVGQATKVATSRATLLGRIVRPFGRLGSAAEALSGGTFALTGKAATLLRPVAGGLRFLSRVAPGVAALVAGADTVRALNTDGDAARTKAIGVAGLSTLSAGLAIAGFAFPPLFLAAGGVGIAQIVDDRTGNHLSSWVGKPLRALLHL